VKAEDRIAIADIVARYADAVNASDAIAWGATWAQDCTWEPGPDRVLHGRDAVVGFWQTAMASFESVVQVLGHGHAREEGGGAVGSWTLIEVNRRDGANGIVIGNYRDRYVRREGSWLFAERRFAAVYRGGLPDGAFTGFLPLTGADH
jgi:ketosteroid isomerase-like protein